MELSLPDAARLLNVTEEQVQQWIQREALPHYSVQEQMRFNREEVLDWAAAHHHPVRETGPRSASESPRLSEALARGGIFHDLLGATPDEVFHELLNRLPLPPEVDRDLLCQMAVAREKVAPTGLDNGVAIPHMQGPLIEPLLEHPMAALAFLRNPVDWRSLDGKPVSIVFLLISPTVFAHLTLLAEVANSLSQPAFQARLRERAAPADLLAGFRALEELAGQGTGGQGRAGQEASGQGAPGQKTGGTGATRPLPDRPAKTP
ncbi:MAG: PTS transporter subunit EIIA [Candidatus Riflebacteria bacterium]|nr:PTS transporter subunit EIIA [Candidatus Riflebacteria bacterium]